MVDLCSDRCGTPALHQVGFVLCLDYHLVHLHALRTAGWTSCTMTPKQLRQNARNKLASSKSLLAAGQYDDASYLAGYAIELALKARYCTRNQWADFPDDRAEATRRGVRGMLVHDLKKLLKLSDHISLQNNSMLNIDWDRALDWSEQRRYQPVGSVTREPAEKQIEETEKLFDELALFEIVEKLLIIEREVSQSQGPFTFFGLAENATQNRGWEVIMAAWWLDKDRNAKKQLFVNRLKEYLEDDLFAMIADVGVFSPKDTLIQRFHQLGRAFGGFFEHSPRLITRGNFILDRVLPSAFIITNAPRPVCSLPILQG
jgi:HEPN domain